MISLPGAPRLSPTTRELADLDVFARVRVLALEDVDLHFGLILEHRVEYLAPAHRDRRVLHDDRPEAVGVQVTVEFAERADAERVGRRIDQDGGDFLARDGGALDRGAESDAQIGIDLATWRHAEGFLQPPLDQRRPGGAADKQDLVHLRHRQVGALQRHVDGIQRFFDERPDQSS